MARTKSISDETIQLVQQRVHDGESTAEACRRAGISTMTYYLRSKRLAPSNGACHASPPDASDELASLRKEVTQLRGLCAAQGTLLKSYGFRLELIEHT